MLYRQSLSLLAGALLCWSACAQELKQEYNAHRVFIERISDVSVESSQVLSNATLDLVGTEARSLVSNAAKLQDGVVSWSSGWIVSVQKNGEGRQVMVLEINAFKGMVAQHVKDLNVDVPVFTRQAMEIPIVGPAFNHQWTASDGQRYRLRYSGSKV